MSDITSQQQAQAKGDQPAPKAKAIPPGQWHVIDQSKADGVEFFGAIVEECERAKGDIVRRVRARFNAELVDLPSGLAGEFIACDEADPVFPPRNAWDYRQNTNHDDIITTAGVARGKMNASTHASRGDMQRRMQDAQHILDGLVMQERHAADRAHRQEIRDAADLAHYEQCQRGKLVYERMHPGE